MYKPVLICEKIAKQYHDANTTIHVLQEVNLTIMPGEMVSIVGMSGSGKSTLLHLLGGLDKPTSGQVILNGNNIHYLSENVRCRLRNQLLGFIYQFHHLLPEFSALENVAMPLLIRGENINIIKEKSSHLLEQVGLSHRLHHRLGQLSGGERQRVAIARALVVDPMCILADEPTGNLDPHNAERVLELFFNLQKTHMTSVVIVTHDPVIAKRAHRAFKLEEGCLISI